MRIGIIGAGVTGLTTGYELSKRGHEITIFDENPTPGGLVRTTELKNGIEIEEYYHHIFTNDTDVISLIKQLGLADQISWYYPKNAIYINGNHYPLTSAFDLLRFKELTLYSRIRTGLMVLKSRYVKNINKLDNTYAGDWIIKNAGRESYEKIWKHLLKSKFDKDADNISGTWIWNKFKLRGSSRSKGINKESLGYLKGSFGRLCCCLAKEIEKNKGIILQSTRVASIKKCGSVNHVEVTCQDSVSNKPFDKLFDKIIFTGAPKLLADIASSVLPCEYLNMLSQIKYKANICIMLEYNNSNLPLAPYYWITVADPNSPYVLYIEHTNLVTDGGYASNIIYLSRYVDSDDELYKKDDVEIIHIFTSYLLAMIPEFKTDNIISAHVSKAAYAQPVVVRKYKSLIPNYTTPSENLYIASMAQIYPEDRGINHAVRLGMNIAEIISPIKPYC